MNLGNKIQGKTQGEGMSQLPGQGQPLVACLQGLIRIAKKPEDMGSIVAQAEAHYQQALALAEELGMRPLQAHCHRDLGTLYARIGRREQARTELATAVELYRTMDIAFWLPQAEEALAQTGGVEGLEGGVP